MIVGKGQQQIGEFAPFSGGGGSIALGRTYVSAASKYAGLSASKLTGGTAVLAQHAAAVVSPTKEVLSVRSANPTSGPADEPSSGVPKPVLIGAGVLGVLALGLIAYKATR